jgi:putative hydrolase of the HAD superfamily
VSHRYRAVLFDLFDTLVRFDRRRLPEIEIEGRIVHSTVRHLHEVLQPHAPGIDLASLHAALITSWQEAERRRAADHREVPAQQRFSRVLECLAVDPARCQPGLVEALLETHRRELGKAAEFPPHYAPLLARLAQHYRLAVVSNFDYSPTALGILESAGVTTLFGAIVVSDAFGWRKPAPAIFREALRRLDVGPGEGLFVGDRADIDVAGAHGVGMDAAWINPDHAPLPPGLKPPEFEIGDLAELERLLLST